MIGRLHRQSSLFYVAFHREASLIKDDLLEPIDALLEDEELIDLVREALGRRHPQSRTRGRRGIAPDRLLRCCVLKHVKGWSLRELEREVRGSLVYRRFTRFDQDPVPNYSNFSRAFAALGEDVTRQIHARVVDKARQEGIARGRKLRTDSTVVESNVHYPTDSTLLSDGVRVLTRALKRVSAECAEGAVKVVDHARAAKHRVLEIRRAAKSFTETCQEQMKQSYGKLVELTGGIFRKAEQVCEQVRRGSLPIVGNVQRVFAQVAQLEHFGPLVKKVIDQTQARVFGGDTHVQGKILSLFEEHTQVIRKGKAHKPTEFGRLVRIDEVENGIVSNYDVKDGNPGDQPDWVPALSHHKDIFGRAPTMATADRGYSSASNERAAKELGVKQVVLPTRGRRSHKRAAIEKQRWFQRALRWRGGIEARIGTLKHRFDMVRARYKGDTGFKRHVGWSIITSNLVSIARAGARRKARVTVQRPQRVAGSSKDARPP
jgi:IS5 family transposase